MNPFALLKQIGSTPSGGGDGIRVTRTLNIVSDLRTAAGLVLTAATSPAVLAVETNGLIVSAAATVNTLGSFNFAIPRDYDRTADQFRIAVLANSGGATDTPTLNATIYRKRAGAALTADAAPTASAAIPGLAAPAAIAAQVFIVSNSKGFRGGDVLTINLTSAAHTTDTIQIYGVEVQYRSAIVFDNADLR